MNRPSRIALFSWVLVGALLGWQANAIYTNDKPLILSGNQGEEHADLDQFWGVWELLNREYIDIAEITDEARVYGAIKGMVDSLGDPYTYYMDPEESEAFTQSLNSELQGIGAELIVKEGRLTVVAPLKDSPAERAGLLPQDYITYIDGEHSGDMTFWDAIMAIRGEPGTEVVLTVERESADESLDIAITRSAIHVPSIETAIIEEAGKTIAHVSIYSFANDTYIEFREALREVRLANADALVLDLRRNGGGFLDVSVEILGEFFKEKVKAVIVKNGDGTNEMIYTDGRGSMPEIPLAVLIDEGSASASEILAGALQDYDRALLLGETSFGKGSVQELSDLFDGSALRVTVAKWFTPNDRSINHEGIEPDVILEMEPTDIDTEEDTQLNAAVDYLLDL